MTAPRVLAERALRAVALGALGIALWGRLRPAPPAPAARAERAGGAELPRALARWTAAPVPAADVRFDALPGPETRAWLAALAAAGTRVTWRAERAPALAAAAEPVADPAGGARLLVAAPAGTSVTAADALGPLDSARAPNVSAAGAVVALALPDAGRPARAGVPGAEARAAGAPAVRLGAVLVVGRAGWEGKFAAAALEERGWAVRARFGVAPGVTVAATGTADRGAPEAPGSLGRPAPSPAAPASAAPGTSALGTPASGAPAPGTPPGAALPAPAPPPRLDTAALAAVVALDSSAAPLAPALARYVRAGGGLVLAGDAALVPGLAALAPAGVGAVVDDSAGALRPLERPRADAVPLAWRRAGGARVLVAAARRVGAGRVVQLADAESWRRRMRADDGADAEHRAWWAQAVAAAAYAPAVPNAAAAGGEPASRLAPPTSDPAPLASTVAALGVPAADGPNAAQPTAPTPPRIPGDRVLIPLALAALLAEVASRRLRGAA